jgi:hypothetical protein
MRTNIHALSGIRIHDISVQAIMACAADSSATGTDITDIIAFIVSSNTLNLL